VTSTAIDVGALATLSGPIAADFGPIVPGVEAYFDMVNAHGGINGRKLVMAHALDDGGSPTQNADLARTLVQQDHVFAVVGVATAFFSGAPYLASSGTPTFGFATENDWTPAPNLFAAYGSIVSYTSSLGQFAFLAHQLHTTSVGVLAYNVPQSAEECQTAVNSFNRYGIHVGYSDLSIPYLGDLSSDVLRMKQAGVDLVVSCMDVSGNLGLARTMQQNGLGNTQQLWFDGYDRTTLEANAPLMQHTHFLVQHVPFEAASAFPGKFPGLQTYLAAMKKYEPKYTYNEVAMDGWLSAALFAQGVKAAGSDLTQKKLVDDINHITNFTAGLSTPVNWTLAHTVVTSPECESYVTVVGSKFQLAFNHGTNIWTCFPTTDPDPTKPVQPPPGSPLG
jgi:ABC-type branched-subunit amino acid transport system substrate-binding protein